MPFTDRFLSVPTYYEEHIFSDDETPELLEVREIQREEFVNPLEICGYWPLKYNRNEMEMNGVEVELKNGRVLTIELSLEFFAKYLNRWSDDRVPKD